MRTLKSSFRSNFSSALDELLNDVEQIKSIVSNPKWKQVLSESGEKNDVLLSRMVFDLSQANDHILKIMEQSRMLAGAGINSPEQKSLVS
jgi:hypothetical protein